VDDACAPQGGNFLFPVAERRQYRAVVFSQTGDTQVRYAGFLLEFQRGTDVLGAVSVHQQHLAGFGLRMIECTAKTQHRRCTDALFLQPGQPISLGVCPERLAQEGCADSRQSRIEISIRSPRPVLRAPSKAINTATSPFSAPASAATGRQSVMGMPSLVRGKEPL